MGVSVEKYVEKNGEDNGEEREGEKNQFRKVLAGKFAENLRYGGYYKPAEKVENCCSIFSALICEHCGSKNVRATSVHCRVRLCPFCEESRSIRNRNIARILLKRVKIRPKFLTLTVKNREEISAEWISEISKSFRRLRQRKSWKNHVLAGFQSVEVTWSEVSGFHPHFHLAIDAHFWNALEISKTWEEVTRGDGKIIKIKEIRGDGVDEFCKYVAKAADYADQWRVTVALFEALKGKRLFSAFGAWFGIYQDIKKEIEDEKKGKKCPDCGSELTFSGTVGGDDVYLCQITGDFFLCVTKAREVVLEHGGRLDRVARARGF